MSLASCTGAGTREKFLLHADGEPGITDFGLARQVEDNSQLTVTGQVLGTPSLMAREQAAGENHVSASADV